MSAKEVPLSHGVQTSPATYPEPSVPVVPVFDGAAVFARGHSDLPSVCDVSHVLYTSSGAAAIALALRHAGIGEGDEVLLPAYHCLSMVEPVQAVQARPVFYQVRADLSVDLGHLETKIGKATRALLATHYFGFPQDMTAIRALADRHGLRVIEDCAHAFFGLVQNRAVGTLGDYAIASARKFFPIHDGGCLVSMRHPVENLELRPVGLIFHMKAAINIVEEAFAFGRARVLFLLLRWPLRLKDAVWRTLKPSADHKSVSSIGPVASVEFRYFAPERMDRAMSFPSRAIMVLSGKGRIVERRRSNFRRMVAGLSGLPNGRPLYDLLPDSVVPYMVPFVIDQPEIVFPVLKRRGVPIYRWETLATDGCSVSNDYAQRLLQLPCHPELREAEIDWMIACIRDTLSEANRGNRHEALPGDP